MRWRKPREDELALARKKYLANWHRRFAWLPVMCDKTRVVFWLEPVWLKGHGEYRWYNSRWCATYKQYDYVEYEIRGGWKYPEIRQPLPGQTSTVVQP